MESPGAYVDDEFHLTIFAFFVLSDPPLVAYHLERVGFGYTIRLK